MIELKCSRNFGAGDARSGRKLVVKNSNIELKNPPICSVAVSYTGIASQRNALFARIRLNRTACCLSSINSVLLVIIWHWRWFTDDR